MKHIIVVTISIFISASLYSQGFSLQIGAGSMNYGGDLQNSKFTFNQGHAAITGAVGVKLNSHFTTFFSVTAGRVSASDANSTSKHQHRNLSFNSDVGEAALTLQYDLIDITGMQNFTPYGFIGVGGFGFKPYAYDTGGNKTYLQPLGTEGQGLPGSDKKLYGLTQFEIPFGIGAKYALTDHIFLGLELGFRKLFTDYLDDVSSSQYADTALLRAARGPLAAKMSFRADEIPGSNYSITSQRGNPNGKDTYYTVLIKLTFSFDKSYYLF
jgi:hypothetical protein